MSFSACRVSSTRTQAPHSEAMQPCSASTCSGSFWVTANMAPCANAAGMNLCPSTRSPTVAINTPRGSTSLELITTEATDASASAVPPRSVSFPPHASAISLIVKSIIPNFHVLSRKRHLYPLSAFYSLIPAALHRPPCRLGRQCLWPAPESPHRAARNPSRLRLLPGAAMR